MRNLIGRTLGHYRIVEKIGEGGMGEVYRARDERLERDVAIKVLPGELTTDADRLRRFEREAKAVAALSHSNILEIHDFDTEGEVTFAVTELLEGKTLQEHIQDSNGSLPWRQVLEIGAAVANGLGASHGKGVVHRDIKPSNIFLCSDGRVKILDFGLAATREVVDSEGETGTLEAPLTRAGSVMGTVGYMAPEQVRGEPADSRTDIFLLGCVLHEMLTGERAFKRDTTAEIMTAILHDDPPSFSELGVRVAPEIEESVLRCLEKRPERRFQSAVDLAYALGGGSRSAPPSIGANTTVSRRKRGLAFGTAAFAIVVLAVVVWVTLQQTERGVGDLDPKKVVIAVFENRTGDDSLDSFGALIPEALSEGAAGIGDFSVVPSPTALGGQSVVDDSEPGLRALRGLSEETGSKLVVSGSYYLMGEDLRFQAQLVDAASGEILYAAPAVTGPRESSGSVIEALRQRVLGAVAWYFERDDFQVLTPPLLAAYMEYQGPLGKERDIESWSFHLRKATDLDPSFYSAWKRYAVVYSNHRLCGRAAQVLDEAEVNLSMFTSFERLDLRRFRDFLTGDWHGFLLAARKQDGITDGGHKFDVGLGLIALNQPRAAIAEFSQIPVPTNEQSVSWWIFWIGRAHHMLGEHEQELESADTYLELFPSNFFLFGRKVAALAALGRLEEIDEVIDEVGLIQSPWFTVMDTMVRAAGELRAHGYRDEAHQMAGRAVEWWEAQPESDQAGLRPYLVDALILAERWSEAKLIADKLLEELDALDGSIEEEGGRSNGGNWWGDGSLVASLGRAGTLAARLGNFDEAQRIADRLRDFDSSCIAGNRTYERACIATQLGNNDEAIELLRKAVSQGYWGFWAMGFDPNLEALRNDPEFLKLVRPKG